MSWLKKAIGFRLPAVRCRVGIATVLLGGATVLSTGVSLAAAAEETGDADHAGHDHAGHDHGKHDADRGDAEHGDAEHGGHDAAHSFNLYYGLLGENAEIDHPTLAYRTPGMPVPFVAYLFNAALLFYLLFRFGKKPLMMGLHARRQRILHGMEEAGKMKADAEAQLAQYQAKLDSIEQEVARIRKEMREAADAERSQILADAKRRRERMELEAKQLIVQELKAAREQLFKETVKSAMETAQRTLQQQVAADDHQRLSDEYVATLSTSLSVVRGGQA